MLKLYVHKKCSTCQKALNFMSEEGIACEVLDIQKTPPSKRLGLVGFKEAEWKLKISKNES